MYSYNVWVELISIVIVGGATLCLVHWLVTHHALYKRFFVLAIATLLLIGFSVTFALGYTHSVDFFDDRQKELLTCIILLFCFVLTRICNIVIWDGLLVKNGRPIFPKVLVRFINFLVFLIACFFIIQMVYDINITKLLVASSLVALILAYGAQSTLSNIFSGITLNITRTMEIGDWIEIEMAQNVFVSGFIESLDWRCVTLKNYDENWVIIPNQVLAEKICINYSQPITAFKQHFYLKIAYTVRPDEVILAFKKALSENLTVLKNKPIEVYLSSLEGDGAIYHVEFFSERYVNHHVKDEILRSVYYQTLRNHRSAAPFVTFSRIPHPSDAVHINRDTMLHLLSSQPIINCLNQHELSTLINTADFERFAIDEILLEQNKPNTSIYILLEGGLQIEHQSPNESNIILATIHSFSLIGEYSMLLDELPRQTVRCIQESLVMIIRREVFHRIIIQRVEIIEQLKDVIERRQSQNISEISQYLSKKSTEQKIEQGSVLERLKHIFKIDE